MKNTTQNGAPTMTAPHFQTIEEIILHNMSRAEKRGSKADFEICLEVVLFLAKKLGMRYRAADLRDVAENVHRILQSVTIPPSPFKKA